MILLPTKSMPNQTDRSFKCAFNEVDALSLSLSLSLSLTVTSNLAATAPHPNMLLYRNCHIILSCHPFLETKLASAAS